MLTGNWKVPHYSRVDWIEKRLVVLRAISDVSTPKVRPPCGPALECSARSSEIKVEYSSYLTLSQMEA